MLQLIIRIQPNSKHNEQYWRSVEALVINSMCLKHACTISFVTSQTPKLNMCHDVCS